LSKTHSQDCSPRGGREEERGVKRGHVEKQEEKNNNRIKGSRVIKWAVAHQRTVQQPLLNASFLNSFLPRKRRREREREKKKEEKKKKKEEKSGTHKFF